MNILKDITLAFFIPYITLIIFTLNITGKDEYYSLVFLTTSILTLLLFRFQALKLEYHPIEMWSWKFAFLTYFSIYAVDRVIYFIFTGNVFILETVEDSNVAITSIGIITSLILAPLIEEFVYRRFLYQSICEKTNKIFAALLSSFLWSIAHVGLPSYELVQIFITGVFLCGLADKKGGIYLCILVHVVINIIY